MGQNWTLFLCKIGQFWKYLEILADLKIVDAPQRLPSQCLLGECPLEPALEPCLCFLSAARPAVSMLAELDTCKLALQTGGLF